MPDYKQNEQVQYYSATYKQFIDCVVEHVDDATGDVELSCKRGYWMPVEEQRQRLRLPSEAFEQEALEAELQRPIEQLSASPVRQRRSQDGPMPRQHTTPRGEPPQSQQPASVVAPIAHQDAPPAVVAVSSGTWSLDQLHLLDPNTEKEQLRGHLQVVDADVVCSLKQAVKMLNEGQISCKDGFCVVWSASSKLYAVLYKSGRKESAFARLEGVATVVKRKMDPPAAAGGAAVQSAEPASYIASAYPDRSAAARSHSVPPALAAQQPPSPTSVPAARGAGRQRHKTAVSPRPRPQAFSPSPRKPPPMGSPVGVVRQVSGVASPFMPPPPPPGPGSGQSGASSPYMPPPAGGAASPFVAPPVLAGGSPIRSHRQHAASPSRHLHSGGSGAVSPMRPAHGSAPPPPVKAAGAEVAVIAPGGGTRQNAGVYESLGYKSGGPFNMKILGSSHAPYDRYPASWHVGSPPPNLESWAEDLLTKHHLDGVQCCVFGSRGGQVVLPTLWKKLGGQIPPAVVINGGCAMDTPSFQGSTWPQEAVTLMLLGGQDYFRGDISDDSAYIQETMSRVPRTNKTTAVLFVREMSHMPQARILSGVLGELIKAAINWKRIGQAPIDNFDAMRKRLADIGFNAKLYYTKDQGWVQRG